MRVSFVVRIDLRILNKVLLLIYLIDSRNESLKQIKSSKGLQERNYHLELYYASCTHTTHNYT